MGNNESSHSCDQVPQIAPSHNNPENVESAILAGPNLLIKIIFKSFSFNLLCQID